MDRLEDNLLELYGEAEETNEKLICRAEKAESEIATLEEALEARLIELEASCNGDSAETYTTGYRNGHRNGQIELIEWVLKKPSKSVCQVQQTHKTQEIKK